ncbi:rab11 family-interacting protein 1 isoform X2 [Mugil cephalus]|uniref:rab11 family-interacting protein 1 isoform X2 n=1 Tax=Mugil cephalus TaxID=48193 RepID=UPI001FB6D8D1|nr:rab11 family-interacting protein 1 isoform X2 [Mugil cephalus]
MSSLTVDEDQKWVPTHVQVTVLKGRGLRGKGKHGTSDVYTIIQLGKEKYSTCVAEKTTEPEWREECSFELQPGVLERDGRSGHPAGSNELVLTVMHRALGPDAFLGQAVIQLDKVFHETRCVKNHWYRLNSKTGKKEKERGDIQVTVQFTRNNLTASMYDLVMKDKSASTFSKLKERMRGKRRSSEEDSSSAVLSGGYGSLCRMRQRLPSDGGGEEDYEDDEGGEARRSKMRTFFLRGKLRKSSDTRSSTSLGSESSESSSRGGSLSPTAGISVVVSDLSNSPSNSSNLTADNSPEHTANTSPKSSSLKCEFADEAGEITIAVPQRTVCVNGSHAYDVQPLDPGSGKPAGSLGLGLLQKSLPLSVSLQNLSPRGSTDLPRGPVGDGRRWSFDKPGEEEKAAIAAALEKSGPMLSEEDARLRRDAPSKASSSSSGSTAETGTQGKKQKKNLFSHGRSEPAGKGQSQSKDESEQAPAAAEERHKGWFGSKDSHSKLSSRPPITQLFPQPSNTNLSLTRDAATAEESSSNVTGEVGKGPRPPALTEGRKPLVKKSSNPFMSVRELEPDSEWDESFEAFAAGRLQPPEDPATECKTQQSTPSDHPLEHGINRRASSPHEPDSNTNVDDAPCSDLLFEAQKFSSRASGAFHLDTFPQFLETIPEHRSFESDDSALSPSTNSPKLTERDPSTTNDLTADTNVHRDPFHTSSIPPSSSSPDPSSSGLGSSAEDFLSCLSSHSDKFSASSSEENESNVPGFEKSSESAVMKTEAKPSESEDDVADGSNDASLDDVVQQTVIEHEDSGSEKVELEDPECLITTKEAGAEGADTQTLNVSNVVYPDLQPKPSTSSDLKNTRTDVTTPDVEISSTLPSLYITTSSPGVQQHLLDSSFEGVGSERRDAGQLSIFDDCLNISQIGPGQDFDSTLLHASATSSFLQSLYVSADSQDYQTCESQPSSEWSGVSEPNETLHSANSTLCGDVETFAGADSGLVDANASVREGGINQDEASFTAGEDFPAAVTHSDVSFSPERLIEGGDGDMFLNCSTLQRSQSEGTLAPAFDQLLLVLPSFGSDPGAIQASGSSSHPGPDLPSLSSFAPFLNPECSSSPVFPLPPLANASATLPTNAAAKPQEAEQQQQQQQQQQQAANQQNSPHPVKPLTTAMQTEEKRSVLATGLEKLKFSIHPGRSSQVAEQETDKRKSLTEGAGSYYHLNHSELVALLVQREAELERQKAEFERQKRLLAKREVELKRLKPQVRDLEDYIDTLLVRIMEQKPTLLQVRSKFK